MFFENLSDFLMYSVNQRISDKQKEKLPLEKLYFAHRAKTEETVILGTYWSSFFDECTWLNEPVEDPKTLTDSDLVTFQLVIIQALKSYIDLNREQEPNVQRLHEIYLKLKSELETRKLHDPSRDGFQAYIEARTERDQFDTARQLGNICIHCGSKNVTSNGSMWSCGDCGKSFRKR